MIDPIDDMLTDAGRQWRAGHPSPPEPDTARWPERQERPQRNRRWVPALAAAAATVIAAGTAVLLVNRPDRTDGVPVADPVAAAVAEALVVRDGDTVQASGTVLSLPGEPVRFCAPAPVALGGGGDGRDACRHYVPVTGVDLDALTGVTGQAGIRQGSAHLVGVWRAGALTVTRQGPPTTDDSEPAAPDKAPCPAPQGGWKTDQGNDSGAIGDTQALHDYIERQYPEQFRPLRLAHPGGAEVFVIEVVKGDVTQARSELEQRYTGNLCVIGEPGRPSIADQKKILGTVGEAVGRLMDDRSNGIYLSENDDTVRPGMVLLTPQLYDKFTAIGFAVLEPDPWLRPVE